MRKALPILWRSIRRHVQWLLPPRALGVRHGMRGKLMRVVALTTMTALLLSGAATLVRDLSQYRRSQSSELVTEADILALATAPALAFDDSETARRTLAALQARPAVLVAALYNLKGGLFAIYAAPGQSVPSRLPGPSQSGLRISGDRIELTRRVIHNDEWLGTVYLLARYNVAASLRDYAGILVLVTAISLLAALFLSTALQRSITAPLDAMAGVARRVVGQRDFSLRAPRTTDDEVGVVVAAFNSMLDEVQARTRELEQFNVALRSSQARFRATFDIAAVGVANVSPDGRFVLVNDRLCAVLGYPREELLNNTFSDITHPDDLEADWLHARDLLAGQTTTYSMEKRYRRKDGTFIWANLTASLVRNEDSTPAYFISVIEDISQRKAAEAQLRASEAALREADRRKDVFIATLAHELRNPLAPLRVAARLLGSASALKPSELQNTRAIIGRQVQHMALLLDDLLDVSRITRGVLELKKDLVDLAESIEAALEAVRPLIQTKGHRLTVKSLPQPVILEADSVRLTQIITNLVTNAAKYTDPGGDIVLSVEAEAAFIAISVRDSGIGLAAEALPKLFEMFSQIQAAGTHTDGGLGIGLALVKGLVELHGGRIEVRSEGLGRGSEFIVYLPRADGASNASSALDEPPLRSARTRRVLLADDNRDVAQSLALFLRLVGHEVALAYSGPEALSLAESVRPEILLLDIGMPGMTGYEVARQIRRCEWATHSVLIAITGWGQEEDRQQSRAAGFDYHMTKPVDPAAIQLLLHQIDEKALT